MSNRSSSSGNSNKAIDRQAFLEQSIKQVRKGFQNYAPFSNDNMMTLVLQPTPDTLPVGALAETTLNGDPLMVIPTVQFPHIYPHPSVSLTCVVCSQPVASCSKMHTNSNIRFIASSPAPFIAFCDMCVNEIFVRN